MDLARSQREEIALLRLHQKPLAEREERGADRAAVGGDAADESAALAGKKMYVALDVAHRDDLAKGKRRGEPPQKQLVLLPQGRPPGAIQRLHRALVVADEDVTR